MSNQYHPTEILSFKRGDNLATIATNGMMTVSQEFELMRQHRTLHQAIASLEAKGYTIDTSNFNKL